MATKKVIKGTRRRTRPSIEDRARDIIADKTYSAQVRRVIKRALEEKHVDLAHCVEQAEDGEIINDISAEEAILNRPENSPHALAALISAVLKHPLTPPALRNALGEHVQGWIDAVDHDTPGMILAGLLATIMKGGKD